MFAPGPFGQRVGTDHRVPDGWQEPADARIRAGAAFPLVCRQPRRVTPCPCPSPTSAAPGAHCPRLCASVLCPSHLPSSSLHRAVGYFPELYRKGGAGVLFCDCLCSSAFAVLMLRSCCLFVFAIFTVLHRGENTHTLSILSADVRVVFIFLLSQECFGTGLLVDVCKSSLGFKSKSASAGLEDLLKSSVFWEFPHCLPRPLPSRGPCLIPQSIA